MPSKYCAYGLLDWKTSVYCCASRLDGKVLRIAQQLVGLHQVINDIEHVRPIQSNLYCKHTADRTQQDNRQTQRKPHLKNIANIENEKKSYENAGNEVSKCLCTTI